MKRSLFLLLLNLACLFSFGQEAAPQEQELDNKVYVAVEERAQPAEEMRNFYDNFSAAFRLPAIADKSIQELRVLITFVVEKDGSFSDAKVIRDPGFGAGSEAIRVLKSMPKWIPGMQNGKAVRAQFTLPIIIKVN